MSTMPEVIRTGVLVVGAGPVGLVLAMDLARRGVPVLAAETRRRGEPPSVKCNHVSARSMEAFRLLGVAARVREAGLPADYPHDVAYRTSTTGTEIARIRIPGRAGRATAAEGPDTWWPTPEPPHRVNQIFLEPILFDHAVGAMKVPVLDRTRIDDFEQDDEGVVATGTNLDTGEPVRVACRYLVGCDGGRSTVRRRIGARLAGDEVIGRVQSTYFRSRELLALLRHPPAWGTFSVNPRRSGNVYAIDGRETWLLHNYLGSDEPEFDSVDRDWAIREILGVGPQFQYEILSKEDWVARRLVADRFRDRRVFICGDASHLWVPMAGYGMNAGIADAMNLSWLLAATLRGWGGEHILDAYEAERQPITEQVSRFAMNHALAMQARREAVPADIERPGPEGDAVRAAFGRALYDLNVQQYCCGGLNFGYFYDGSPLVAYDGEQAPPYTMYDFHSSTVPGCRAPHFWVGDGRSLYDVLGPGYTLLRLDRRVDAAPLVRAAAASQVPFSVLDIKERDAGPAYERNLTLVRPDQHVAWRGDEPPADPQALIDLVRGARPCPT
jgi:2-polyprenyl-6-methoxyphenol hydroxylase-like FAD-dependent oxidoreductase